MAIPSPSQQAGTPAILKLFNPEDGLDHLRSLLNDPSTSHEALGFTRDPSGFIEHRDVRTLYVMLDVAARAGRADLVKEIFSFADSNSVPLKELIGRYTVISALASERVDVFAEFVAVQPDVVNFHLGLSGDPLGQAIIGPHRAAVYDKTPEARVPLVKYLLEKGANPNAVACQFVRPGYHLYTAINSGKPIEMTRLLLDHGAQIPGSGAVFAAAETGRVDVLQLLHQRGVDINEPLGTDIQCFVNPQEAAQRAAETPLDAARRKEQEEAVVWLMEHGA